MDSVVEVDAGENGEDIGLQERDQQLERGQRDGQAEWQDGAEPADETDGASYRRSSRTLSRDMAANMLANSRTECEPGFQEDEMPR